MLNFGLYIRSGETYQGFLELALLAEDLGLFGVFLNDHVHGFANEGKEPYLEAWTAMSGIGVQTSRIRLGHIVLFNSLRNPAFLAKSIATLDQMTNGRYELLLGAGWNEPEYIGYDLMGQGRGMPSPKERVDRFKETLEIIKGMLSNEVFSYQGQYWILKDATNIPQPIQKPFRISVGAEKPRMLALTAKYADGLNIGGNLKDLEQMIAKIKPYLLQQNKSVEKFYFSGFTATHIAKSNDEYHSLAKKLAEQSKKTKEEIMTYGYIGTPEILIEKYRKAADLGLKLMITIPRPSTNVLEIKNLLAYFNDNVITQL